jgi:hypothetical protein
MPGSGTRTFLEQPDHDEASPRQAQIEILIALSPKFKTRLTAEGRYRYHLWNTVIVAANEQLRSSQS